MNSSPSELVMNECLNAGALPDNKLHRKSISIKTPLPQQASGRRSQQYLRHSLKNLYQPSGTACVLSPSATPHQLQDENSGQVAPKWPVGFGPEKGEPSYFWLLRSTLAKYIF